MIKEQGTKEERNTPRKSIQGYIFINYITTELLVTFSSYSWNYVFAWSAVTHGTTSSHGYGLDLRYNQLVTSQLSALDNLDALDVKLYFFKNETRRKGSIKAEEFW